MMWQVTQMLVPGLAGVLTPGEVKNIWRCLNGETLWQRQARQSWQRVAAQCGIDLGAAAGEAA
jgi:hypothetical protein